MCCAVNFVKFLTEQLQATTSENFEQFLSCFYLNILITILRK